MDGGRMTDPNQKLFNDTIIGLLDSLNTAMVDHDNWLLCQPEIKRQMCELRGLSAETEDN
jgi:hypothetical protein